MYHWPPVTLTRTVAVLMLLSWEELQFPSSATPAWTGRQSPAGSARTSLGLCNVSPRRVGRVPPCSSEAAEATPRPVPSRRPGPIKANQRAVNAALRKSLGTRGWHNSAFYSPPVVNMTLNALNGNMCGFWSTERVLYFLDDEL